MDTERTDCPICGSENPRICYRGEFFIEEDHYSCENCGYFEHMEYSSYLRGIDTRSGTREDAKRKARLLLIHSDKIKSLDIPIDPEYAKYL